VTESRTNDFLTKLPTSLNRGTSKFGNFAKFFFLKRGIASSSIHSYFYHPLVHLQRIIEKKFHCFSFFNLPVYILFPGGSSALCFRLPFTCFIDLLCFYLSRNSLHCHFFNHVAEKWSEPSCFGSHVFTILLHVSLKSIFPLPK
jgi:hypothetical protein